MEQRARLAELVAGLRAIDRNDLAELLDRTPSVASDTPSTRPGRLQISITRRLMLLKLLRGHAEALRLTLALLLLSGLPLAAAFWHIPSWLSAISIVATGVPWLFLALVRYHRTPSSQEVTWFNRPYRYPDRVRLMAFVGLVIIPLLSISALGLWRRAYPLPDKIVILLAEFAGVDREEYGIAPIIREELEETLRKFKYNDVEVKYLSEPITEKQGRAVAREKGEQYRANFVLWGWYKKTDSSVYFAPHFEMLSRPPRGLPESLGLKRGTVKSEDLTHFELQQQLARDITYTLLVITGMALYEAHNYSEVIARLSEAISRKGLAGVDPSIYFYRGRSYFQEGLLEKAIADFQRVIDLQNGDSPTYNNLGLTYAMQGRLDEAIASFDQAIHFNPNSSLAHTNRGVVRDQKGDEDGALQDYNQAIAVDPSNPLAYNNRALLYLQRRQINLALSDFNQAIQLLPDYFEAYKNRAIVYYAMNNFDRAICDCNRALKLKQDYAPAYLHRGIAYQGKRQYEKAVQNFTQAIRIDPDYLLAYLNRGVAYYETGKFDMAVRDNTEVLKKNKDFAWAYYNRSAAYADMGRFGEALADCDELERLNQKFEAYYRRGNIYQLKGERDAAISNYRKALDATQDEGKRQQVIEKLRRW